MLLLQNKGSLVPENVEGLQTFPPHLAWKGYKEVQAAARRQSKHFVFWRAYLKPAFRMHFISSKHHKKTRREEDPAER